MNDLNMNLKPEGPKLSEKEFKLFKKWLKSHLEFGPVTVTFTKVDGSERIMECTTNSTLIPEVENKSSEPKKEKKKSDEAITVYDLQAKGWRSFRWDSIKQVRFVL